MAATRSAELAAVPDVREAQRTAGDLALSVLKHVVLVGFGITFLFPFWWMLATSLKPDQAMFHIPPLLVPHFFGDAFYIFLLRQFFMTIPQELSEAARIDGAGELRIFTRIVLPLAKPALATVALFEFLARWRDFFGPLLFLTKKETYTISLGLNFYRFEYDTAWGLMMAMSVCVTLPIIILFFFVQRTFIQGITLTGIKG